MSVISQKAPFAVVSLSYRTRVWLFKFIHFRVGAWLRTMYWPIGQSIPCTLNRFCALYESSFFDVVAVMAKYLFFSCDKSCKITNCRSLPGKMSLLMITEKSSAFLLYIKRVNIVDIVKLYYSSFPTNAGRLHQQLNEYKLKCCSLIIICLHFTLSSLSGYLLLYTHPSIFCMWLF